MNTILGLLGGTTVYVCLFGFFSFITYVIYINASKNIIKNKIRLFGSIYLKISISLFILILFINQFSGLQTSVTEIIIAIAFSSLFFLSKINISNNQDNILDNQIIDNDYFNIVAEELKNNIYDEGLKLQAFIAAPKDENQAKAIYIKLRTQQLNDLNKNLISPTDNKTDVDDYMSNFSSEATWVIIAIFVIVFYWAIT